MYIDQQFISDIDFYARISETFSEIIGSIKYYPYPTIVYKIAINKYINSENQPSPAPAKAKPTSTKKEEKAQETAHEETPIIQNPESKIQNSIDGNTLLK
ncbi:MAG: hypothetical protein WCJ39_06165 [bacterium]